MTKNLVAPSHICRDGAWPGQFSMNTVTLINSKTKEFQSAFQIRQHHYCPADGSLQERVPYQIFVTALCENQNLYYMPDSWLEKQPHLLKKGGKMTDLEMTDLEKDDLIQSQHAFWIE